MNNRLRSAARLLGVMLLCGAIAFLAGAVVPNHSVRLGSAAAETSPRGDTALDIALIGKATASTEASGSPASNAIDGSASTDWCSTEWTGSLTVDLGRVRSLDGFGVTLGDTSTTALVNISYGTTAGSLTPVPGAQQQSVPAGRTGLLAVRPRLDQGPVRADRRDRQRRDAAVHRRVSPVRARADERDPGPRRRPVVRAAGRGGRRPLHGQRRPRVGAVDPRRARHELRPAAPVGQPPGRLQRPRERPADGAAHQGRRRQAVPRHPLLGLLGGPAPTRTSPPPGRGRT